MGMTLRGIDGRGEPVELKLSHWSWGNLLSLAVAHGWHPTGTTLSGQPNWAGAYHSNDYQVIEKTDAANLAAALKRAESQLADPSDADYLRKIVAMCQSGGVMLA